MSSSAVDSVVSNSFLLASCRAYAPCMLYNCGHARCREGRELWPRTRIPPPHRTPRPRPRPLLPLLTQPIKRKKSRGVGTMMGPQGDVKIQKNSLVVVRRSSSFFQSSCYCPGEGHLVARERAHDLGGNVQEEDGGNEREREDNDNEGVTVGRVSWCATKTTVSVTEGRDEEQVVAE
jgi:hypothetical protein